MKKLTGLFALLLVALTLTACGGAQDPVFRMGFIPSEKAEELSPKAQALAEFLEKEMGMKIEVVIPTTYEPLIEGIRFNHLDAAYMDSGPAWLTTQKSDAEVVLAELKSGSPFYYGEVFVRAEENNIKSLKDLVDKRIAFTSWTGSSGFIFPIGKMVEEGLIKPESSDFAALEKAIADTFALYTVSGGYKESLQLLIDGKVDVAAGAHDAIEKYLDPADQQKIKSAVRLGKVPSHPVLVSKKLDSTTRDKFVNAMLKLNNPAYSAILQNLYGVSGMTAVSTQEHLGDFGPAFENLTGIHDKAFN